MRKRGTWLKRTAWLALGLILMCGTVDGTVRATETAGGSSSGSLENEKELNFDNVSPDATLFITQFADPGTLKVENGVEPVLPANLKVMVSALVKEETSSSVGAVDVFSDVADLSLAESGTITLTGLSWEKKADASVTEADGSVTDSYELALPDTYGRYPLERVGALTNLPVIKVNTAAPAAPAAKAGSREVATPTDVGGGKDYFRDKNGITVTGSEKGSAVWDTAADRIIIGPGTYEISGTLHWDDPAKHQPSKDPFIELEGSGEYSIMLTGLDIDITRETYTELLRIPANANVNLLIRDNEETKLRCLVDNGVQVVNNMGNLTITTGKTAGDPTLRFWGRFENTGTMVVTGDSTVSPVEINGPVSNKGSMTIEESCVVGTLKFVNDGTLRISEPREKSNLLSTLNVTGPLENNGTIEVEQGSLTVADGPNMPDDMGAIENDGSLLVNGGTNRAEVIAQSVENAGTIVVDGKDAAYDGTKGAILKSNGAFENGGTAKAIHCGQMEIGSLDNSGELAVGEDRDSSAKITITGGGTSVNSGKIEVQAGSYLQRSGSGVTLLNGGRLKIKAPDSLGNASTSSDLKVNIDPNNGENAEFILAGLGDGMIELRPDFSLKYTGEDQTLNVINESDPENSVLKVPEQYEVYGYMFDVKEVNIELDREKIQLTRTKRDSVNSTTEWDPGVSEFNDYVGTIKDPGEYRLTFVNRDNDRQFCPVGPFTMSEWSMVVRTSDKETDGDELSEAADQKRGDKIESAVCLFGDEIRVKVQVAIFQEVNKKGRVSLYWDARNAANTGLAQVESTSKEITLKDGKGTVEFVIKTAGGQETYEMTAPYIEGKYDDVSPAYEVVSGIPTDAPNGPYRLTAVYEAIDDKNDYHRYFNDSSPVSQHHRGLIGQDGQKESLTAWYADKKLAIIRPEIDINFQPNYYTSPRVYDGTPLRLPAGEQDIQVGNRSARSELKYRWYTSKNKDAVDAAYENRDPSGLTELFFDTESNPDADQGPTDAGYYLIEAYVESSKTYMGYRQFRVITIDQRPAKISVKSWTKKYGADDPEEWNDILISNEMNPYYTVENTETTGILPGEEMRGIIRRVKRNETDEEREKCGNHDIEIRVEDNNNYDFDYASNVLTIEKRQLDWDNSQMFMVTTEDGDVSVVGGLNTVYHLEPDEKMEDIVKNISDDDVLVSYEKLDLNSDKNKATVDRKKLSGNDSGNYEIPNDAVSIPSGRKLKLSVKVGSIDASTVEKLQNSDFNTEDKIMDKMQAEILNAGASRGNTVLYDVILTHENGQPLSDQEIEDFPWGALTVTVPYPEGTSKSTSFVAAHMFTENINLDGPGLKPGNVETRNWNQVATVDDGVRFQITSLSPITIGWSATGTNPNDPNNPNNPNGGNNGNNNDPNNPNGGTNGNGSTGNNNNSNNNGTNSNNNNNNSSTTPSNTTTSSNARTTRTSGVQTGDTAEIAFYMITTLVACLLLILIICLIRMQFKKKD